MVCGETHVTFAAMDGQGQPVRWAWNLVGGAKQQTAVTTVTTNHVGYQSAGTDYQLRLAPEGGTCELLSNGTIRLNANHAGEMILILGGS